MLLAFSSMISDIDAFANEELGIPIAELILRSGRAVENVVRARVKAGGHIVVLAGKGNNGADGYAAAAMLSGDYSVSVYDIFSSGQRTQQGRELMEKFVSLGGKIIPFEPNDSTENDIKGADCIVDAIFGTGFSGQMPELIAKLSRMVNEAQRAVKIAVDVPIGVNADTGAVNTTYACTMNATVVLSFIKPGLVSYPAKYYVGEMIFDDLGIDRDAVLSRFCFTHRYLDRETAKLLLPERPDNSNKGNFGKVLLITGSERFRGAGLLSLEAALRGGVGYVSYLGEEALCESFSLVFPEAIYRKCPPVSNYSGQDISSAVSLSLSQSATLVGCGSSDTEGLLNLAEALLTSEGGPVVLDADAINALSRNRERSLALIRRCPRTVILTPHPLEFSRLCSNNVTDIQLHRLESATKFAKENRCILVLKGAGTVVTDGDTTYINSSGSSALAKAGSGDVLAGFIASLVAQSSDPLGAAAAAVYYNGAAAQKLAASLSDFGVIPSDLPRAISACIAEDTANKK